MGWVCAPTVAWRSRERDLHLRVPRDWLLEDTGTVGMLVIITHFAGLDYRVFPTFPISQLLTESSSFLGGV